MKTFFSLSILFCCSSFAAIGQAENWDTYLAKFDGKPGSVLVDMAQYDKAPDKRYPYLVITGPQAHNCDKKGMPDKDEIAVLEEMLDATSTFLTGVTTEVLTGTFMYNCNRMNYYYVKDTMGVRTAIQRLYRRNYKEYNYVLTIKSDPAWRTYLTFLYPSEETQNWMENEKIIAPMIQKGDSVKMKRSIVFQALFKTDTAREAFENYMTAKGFRTEKKVTAEKVVMPQVLTFSKFGALNLDSLNVWTGQIKQEMAKHDGIYQGWTAPVQNSSSMPASFKH